MIRVVIADDHQILREGLKQLLESAGDIAVVGEAGDGAATLERVRGDAFDVLVLDLSMPGRSGMDLIRQVADERPRLRVLVLSMHDEHQYAVRAIRAGAAGYLTKESASSELVAAIRKVAAGRAYVTAAVAEHLALEAMPGGRPASHATLSDREFEVFRRLVAGESVGAIAARLNLSSKTISTHKARLMEKLGVASTADLVRYAMRHRLFDDAGAPAGDASPP
ncbi:MAG: response regulator transcription factor [Proteobacteria bacterium]|jgi:DNA-binding NarL/FixJ family response regulator|nr:response regulator transcription factor [Pseudomonadota bacterium]